MTDPRAIVGRATIRVNGEFFDTMAGAKLIPGGKQNTSRPTSHGYRYTQTYLPSMLTCSVAVGAGQSVKDLQSISGAEITFTADTGQTWIIRNAAQTAQVGVADGPDGGTADLQFEGDAAEEDIG
ncbi:MAG: hypothetical protein GC185_01885 [Alphaproteobacteria bacterium]|nr:hypothetical protein [Alphaproteobacteria bacterium]